MKITFKNDCQALSEAIPVKVLVAALNELSAKKSTDVSHFELRAVAYKKNIRGGNSYYLTANLTGSEGTTEYRTCLVKDDLSTGWWKHPGKEYDAHILTLHRTGHIVIEAFTI